MPDGVRDVDPGYRIAYEVLRRLAPDELPDLPLVWQAYQQRPSTPDDLIDRDRLLGSGLGSHLMSWAPLVVVVLTTDVLGGAALDAAKDGVRSGARRTWRRMTVRLRRPVAATACEGHPVFTLEQIGAVARCARHTALRLGRPPEEAQLFADAIAGGLTVAAAGDDDTT